MPYRKASNRAGAAGAYGNGFTTARALVGALELTMQWEDLDLEEKRRRQARERVQRYIQKTFK